MKLLLSILSAAMALPCLGAVAAVPGGLPIPGTRAVVSPAPARQPGITVLLSKSSYPIRVDPKTGVPSMPRNVWANAVVKDWPAGAPPPLKFTWRVYLDWQSDAYPTHHEIDQQKFVRNSPLTVDLGKQIRGGLLTVTATATVNGKEICGQARAMVTGENPPRKAVLSTFPRSRFGLLASKVGMAESGLRQFTPANGADPGGMPMVSRTKDIGIMQVNAPSGAITSPDQVWDWRANVRRGLEMLAEKRRTSFLASRHADGLQRVQNDVSFQIACLNLARAASWLPILPVTIVPALSDRSGSGMNPGEPDLDHLALSQWDRDTIRRYNGGREYAYTLTPDPQELRFIEAAWKIDASRGGIRPTSGDPNYVLNVLRARSGFTLPAPQPVKHKPVRHRRQ